MPDLAPSSEPDTVRAAPPLRGVDVSYCQPRVDWPAVRAAGMSFAIVKASQRHEDPLFASHWNGARAAGLLVGLYHYLDPALPMAEQIDLFLRTYRSVDGFADIPPALDLEEAARGESADHLTGRALSWVWAVQEELGVTPMIYTSHSFAARYLSCPRALDLAACPLWLAHYTPHGEPPTVPAPWSRWALWQHDGKGRVSGIAGPVDLDVMRPEALGLAAEAGAG